MRFAMSRLLQVAEAAALVAALCYLAAVPAFAKDFDETIVKETVAKVIADRSKDGAFVYHDPKLDADLNLVFEQIKIVRGMSGYGWFANTIFHDKEERPRSNTPSTSGSSPTATS